MHDLVINLDHIPCRDCPAWRQFATEDWSEPLFAVKLADGKQVLDQFGKPVLIRGRDNEPLSWGACCAKLPEFGPNTQTHVTMRSDWWCESKEKHELIERLKKKASKRPRAR